MVSRVRMPALKLILGQRNFMILIGGCTVSAAGSAMAVTAILLHLEAADSGPWAVTSVLIAQTAPTVLLAPIAGYLSGTETQANNNRAGWPP